MSVQSLQNTLYTENKRQLSLHHAWMQWKEKVKRGLSGISGFQRSRKAKIVRNLGSSQNALKLKCHTKRTHLRWKFCKWVGGCFNWLRKWLMATSDKEWYNTMRDMNEILAWSRQRNAKEKTKGKSHIMEWWWWGKQRELPTGEATTGKKDQSENVWEKTVNQLVNQSRVACGE